MLKRSSEAAPSLYSWDLAVSVVSGPKSFNRSSLVKIPSHTIFLLLRGKNQ
jgi:hypothetical protein